MMLKYVKKCQNIQLQDPIDLDWIDLVNKGKNPDIRLYFHLENNK